jgi:hypothetical protein
MKSTHYLSQKHFKENKFTVVRNLISPETANLLYHYTKTRVRATDYKINIAPENYEKEWDGHFQDPQSPNTFSMYGDSMMDTLGLQLLEKAKLYTGENLYFTYTYWRLYQLNNTLVKHTDRKSCSISGTLCLGWDSSNLDSYYNWPIFVEDDAGKEIEIQLNPGDMLFYRGCDLLHWRNKCECLNHSQVFFHYNNVDDNNALSGTQGGVYDGRVMIGVPQRYQKPQI